jgi:creatinine amidohydrolase
MPQSASKGKLIESMNWLEAEKVLTPQAVVVIALGAQAKEHGPHLPLNNDFLMAEYLKRRILAQSDVVIAPTLNYSFYPAFLEYPGSTSLEADTARDMLVDVCRTLAGYGPKRFYIVNTGVSTLQALRPAKQILAANGVLMQFSDLGQLTAPVEKLIKQEAGGTHADEIETSMMLYIAPDQVEIKKAVKDFHDGVGPLTRKPGSAGTFSASGVWGDATLATRSKGEKLVEAAVTGILGEIDQLRHSPLPARTLDDLNLQDYAGIYRDSGRQLVNVQVRENKLVCDIAGRRTLILSPITESRFTSGAVPVHFFRDATGGIAQLTYWFDGSEHVAYRLSGNPPR